MHLPRFHPLITKAGWVICDGRADTEHSLATSYIDEPCADRHEALVLCEVLNEEDDAILGRDGQQDSIDRG